MKKTFFLYYSFLMLLSVSCLPKKEDETVKKPNVIFIYVDDLGYGDLSCYGATEVQTPNVDALAEGGIQFTDAHCTASTCTPSRYSLLTGNYAFRNNATILPGDAPLIINPEQETIADMFKKQGYATAVVGKWHLGLGNGSPDWNGVIKPGPLEIGFDYSFLIPATADRVPTVFVENHKVVNLDPKDPIRVSYDKKIGSDPTGMEDEVFLKMIADKQHSGTVVNGISRIGYMSGGHSAYWKDEEFPNILIKKASNFIASNRDKPFFLYFALPDIHVPRAPNEKFVGKTKMGPRGDAIVQMDWVTGQIMNKLKELNIEKNTIIVFSSDNGPVLNDGYADQSMVNNGNHKPAGNFKGGKYSAYEAGTRVPTIMYWPDKIKPVKSNALISQVDFFASFAKLIGAKIENKETAVDSSDMLNALLGKSQKGRQYLIEEAFTMSIRNGNWKYIAPQAQPSPSWLADKNVLTGLQETPQLYDLSKDPAEKHNLDQEMPEKTKILAAELSKIMGTSAKNFQ
ncbi:arylsulfatase [Flavobacterium sp. KACC 22761]|uniref:sulfatase family protein n=1 Tax=Flavobacterium sp. KACC 22761 TaxID=3092665 RepID=UPI002A766918|nr:arylsulfatase [Flavobacterium sp. KACC 22761]WPO78236.1 arylsulfatase [Flavobacterium sp. KACC 22761]